MTINIFTLAWDTAEGTDCKLFATEQEWFDHFSGIIIRDIDGIDTYEAAGIRNALASGDIGAAYDLWQASYKDELDVYNWETHSIDIGADGKILQIVPGVRRSAPAI